MQEARFPTTYPIPSDVLAQATADYLTVRNAGYLETFRRELTAADWSRQEVAARNHHASSISKLHIDWAAKDLAKLLGCPQYVAAAEIYEQTGPTRRQVVIELLATMAAEIRARDAKRSTSRRIA